MLSVCIPYSKYYIRFISQIQQMIKLEKLEKVIKTQTIEEDQESFIEFKCLDNKKWYEFVNLVDKVSNKTYGKINYEKA